MRRKTHRTQNIVKGFSNNEDISSWFFSSYYEELYNSVTFDSVEWSDLYKTINNKICNECISHIVNVNDVENSIKKLKPGKSDGFDGLTSDYLINTSPLFYVYLSHLFTNMLYYCFTPKLMSKRCESVNMVPLYFKNMPINCVHECDLLGITVSSSRTTDNVLEKAVMKFNMKSNEIITDFKLLPCYTKSKLFTTFVLILTDVSNGILIQEKYIICGRLEKSLRKVSDQIR